ncbi:MAG: hypothetical protein IJ223_04010 [Clostridia bacterium]|nr:hypothetical protein [Clostridia bacterium]
MDPAKGIDKMATVVAIIVGVTQIFGFFSSDENILKLLIIFLFTINLLFFFLLQKNKKDMQTKTMKYKRDLAKLDLELYDQGIQLEASMKKYMDKNPEVAKDILERGMKEYVSKLSQIITLHSEQPINVTLRLLKEDNIETPADATVVYIALPDSITGTRDEQFKGSDAKKGRIIRNNTDFQFLCDDRVITYFYAQDVTKIFGYLNETKGYLNYYKGKVVLPINYYGEDAKNYGYYHTIGSTSFSTLGFIIADTPNPKVFTEERKDYYLNLLGLYAKRSSPLLYSYKYCTRKMSEENNKVEEEKK